MFSLMIYLAAGAGAASTNSEFSPLRFAFENCVRAKVKVYERAKEPIFATVDAAVIGCENEKASIVLYMHEQKKADGSESWSLDRAEKFVDTMIEKPLRNEIVVNLFDQRSGL